MMCPWPCSRMIGHSGLRDPHRPEHVGLQLGARFLFSDFLEEAEMPEARIVHDDVQLPEVVPGLLDGCKICGAVCDVELDGEEGVAKCL